MGKLVAGLSFCVLALATSGLPATATTTLGDLSRVTARSAIVIDTSSNQVLFARSPHQRLPPASTTKLLTAIIAMERGQLDRRVAVSRYASSMPPTKVWLRPGWTPTLRDLLYAMLLRSANDASIAVAEGLGGSVPNFARMMNARARDLGATDSNFMNPNGLPNSRHHSSAADLAKIVKVAIKNPDLRTILSTPEKTVRLNSASSKGVVVRTTNRMIARDDFRVIGKTGYTRLAKRCFAGAASVDGKEVVVVVLGSSNLWSDLELLIDFALRPASRSPQWRPETGWRQVLAPPPATRPQPPIAQGDTGADRPGPRFLFHVQLASLKSQTLANDLLKRVSRLGYNATVEPSEGQATYRVVVRDLASRTIARRVARHLGREFHVDPQIIAVRG
jgi:D-alanyl-D-alanine carboxypeptidase (penicillin-binding protein 5/6)